jgi:hypothetical protein
MSPQETLSPVVPGAEAQATATATPETGAAIESEAPIATQVLAADDTVCQPSLSFPARGAILADNPLSLSWTTKMILQLER